MTVIIDYGMGNLGSVQNALKKIGKTAIVSSSRAEVSAATKIILPGVGSFDMAIHNLHKMGIFHTLKEKIINNNTPTLGICLGMQLLTRGSEEGKFEGLNAIDADTRRFDFTNVSIGLRVPHIGWNTLHQKKESRLFKEMPDKARFYFIHSYVVKCTDCHDVLSYTNYGYDFVSSFEKENILGCQFHPEKSHQNGMQLLKSFSERY